MKKYAEMVVLLKNSNDRVQELSILSEEIKDKKVKELIDASVLPARWKDIEINDIDECNAIFRCTKAYKNQLEKLQKVELKGSEKQVAWATKIRASHAKK
jgi:hypothetical protein